MGFPQEDGARQDMNGQMNSVVGHMERDPSACLLSPLSLQGAVCGQTLEPVFNCPNPCLFGSLLFVFAFMLEMSQPALAIQRAETFKSQVWFLYTQTMLASILKCPGIAHTNAPLYLNRHMHTITCTFVSRHPRYNTHAHAPMCNFITFRTNPQTSRTSPPAVE